MKYTDPDTQRQFELIECITKQNERAILVPIWVVSKPSDWIPVQKDDTIKSKEVNE